MGRNRLSHLRGIDPMGSGAFDEAAKAVKTMVESSELMQKAIKTYNSYANGLVDYELYPPQPQYRMVYNDNKEKLLKTYPKVGRSEHPFVINGVTIMAVDKKTAKKIYQRTNKKQ